MDTWRDGGTTTYDSTRSEVQVCASFAHRRDLAAAVTGAHVGRLPTTGAVGQNQNQNSSTDAGVTMVPMPDPTDAALRAARSGAGPPGSVEVERHGMKRSLAWELASRRIRETERAKARRKLLESHKASYAKDVVLDVELLPGRRVRAVRLPCYIARFTHGELQGVDNKISDAVHHAFVCGHTGNVAVHERNRCQNKVRADGGGVFRPGSRRGVRVRAGTLRHDRRADGGRVRGAEHRERDSRQAITPGRQGTGGGGEGGGRGERLRGGYASRRRVGWVGRRRRCQGGVDGRARAAAEGRRRVGAVEGDGQG